MPYIVGMAKAMEISDTEREASKKKIGELSKYIIKKVTEEIKDVEIIGPKMIKIGCLTSYPSCFNG